MSSTTNYVQKLTTNGPVWFKEMFCTSNLYFPFTNNYKAQTLVTICFLCLKFHTRIGENNILVQGENKKQSEKRRHLIIIIENMI